ncbi:hypothetical protein AYI69_g9005 [Smittium culicis]|uniref:RRM domain-containing protein n=1 Tax=Smittium culicis TaxID=133412 RepID=A0A1R1XFS1_9FUNG|nr:hypothetical protein AYI69_g9005 [Smittium culicis]
MEIELEAPKEVEMVVEGIQEYETYKEAKSAVEGCDGKSLLGNEVNVGFAFVQSEETDEKDNNRSGRPVRNKMRDDDRSRSPTRKF